MQSLLLCLLSNARQHSCQGSNPLSQTFMDVWLMLLSYTLYMRYGHIHPAYTQLYTGWKEEGLRAPPFGFCCMCTAGKSKSSTYTELCLIPDVLTWQTTKTHIAQTEHSGTKRPSLFTLTLRHLVSTLSFTQATGGAGPLTCKAVIGSFAPPRTIRDDFKLTLHICGKDICYKRFTRTTHLLFIMH